MESDRVSERSFCSLNTVNLNEHTTKDKFSVNKDDTVRFYLNSLRDGFDTYAAPDVTPLHEDPPTMARRKISEQQSPQSPAQQPEQQQQQGDVQAKKKRRRRMSEDKENDRPPPPLSPSQLDALAQSPAQPKPPHRKTSGSAARTSARASGVRRRGQAPADAIEAPTAVRGDGGRSSSGHEDCDGDNDGEHGGSDPLKWFRSRSKPTVEEEFEEFKKRFVWNGSRLAASSSESGGRAPGDGAEGRNGGSGSGSGGGISNSGHLAISELRVSGGDAEPTEDRHASDAKRRQRRSKDALASHDRRQQPLTLAARTSAAAASEEQTSPRGAAVTGEAASRLSALATEPVKTAGEDRSTLAKRTVDATAATSSGDRWSPGSIAGTADASANPAAGNSRGKQQFARPSPLTTAAALPHAVKPQLRLPPLPAGPAAAAATTAARNESRSEEPLATIPEAHVRASAFATPDADAEATATAVGSSMDPSKLAAIKYKAKAMEPPPTPLLLGADDSPHPIRRRDSQQSTSSGGTDGAFPTESVAAKVETIKLLAREKQRQRLKLKRMEREQRDSGGAQANALSDPRQQSRPQPAAVRQHMNGRVGRAISRWQRHGELPPIGAETAAGRQSVDKRCVSEVAVAAARRRASDFGEVESRAGASEVHPGRVYNLSMNFDAYVRALERMVDATLKTLAQTEL